MGYFSFERHRILRSSLNLFVVLLFFLNNVDANSVRTVSDFDLDEGDLIFAALVHRHGERFPRLTYATDPYKDFDWPGGLGALSQKGAADLYQLGLNLETRYKSMKPADGFYTQETAHHISSDKDRTKISGACMLAAFYKPHSENNYLRNNWQPVPLDIIAPLKEDYILHQLGSKCPKYDQALNEFLTNPDSGSSIHQYNEANRDLYEYVTLHTGENVTNFLLPGHLYDILLTEESYGLELPEWTKKIYPDEIYNCRVRLFALLTETDDMKHFRGGPIITEIYNGLSSYQNGSSARNLYTYSAHDITISNALAAMRMAGQTDPLPKYGACLVFELRRIAKKNQDIVDFVQMVYYADTIVTIPQRLDITGCPHPCTLNDFAKTFQHLFVRNFTQECQLPI